MPAFSDVYASVKLDLDRQEETKLKRRLGKIDTKDAGRRMGMGMSKNLGHGFRAGIGGAARTMFAPIAAAAAAVGGFSLFKGFIADAKESAKISRLTEQVIKSTGGAANISADQVNKLATAISNKTGVDDEAIQSGANLLLTFTNVRNEVGKGNDIFNQANQAVTDMSVALGQDTKSSAIQLGKALNDPIKGITALSRVGVSFTADQKEQIKTLVESGDVMGAQKVILKELGKEFGGAAEAAADPMDKLKVVVGNLGEEIGAKMLPFVERAAAWLGKNLPGALEAVSGFMRREVMPRLREFGGFFKADILPRLQAFAGFVKDEVVPRLISFGGWIKNNTGVVTALAIAVGSLVAITKIHGAVLAVQAAGGLLAYIKGIKIVQIATKTWAAVQWVLNAALIANPIGIVIAAIAALAIGLVAAYKKSETFRQIVDGAFRWISEVGQSMWRDFLKPSFDAIGGALKWIGDTAESLKRTWDRAWKGIKDLVVSGVKFIVDKFLGFVESIIKGAEKAFGWIPGIGDDLRDAAADFKNFRRKVNNELDAVRDEDIKINIKTYGNLEFGGAGGVSARGGMGGYGGASPLPGVTSHASQAMGGDLDVKTRGLDARRILELATDYLGKTKAAAQKQITKMFDSGQLFAAGPGGFPLPRGRYRVGRGPAGHGYPAIDFPAVTGTPVYAVRSGVVTRALRLGYSYGIHAILGHPGGWGSLYAHMSKMFVRPGQFVRAGQQIGAVGSTGNSTGPHLHFEARRYGARVNPRSMISYASGGVIPEHVIGVGTRSGRPYQFGEKGPETVSPSGAMELSERSLNRLGEIIGRVVLSGIGSAQHGSAQAASLFTRSG